MYFPGEPLNACDRLLMSVGEPDLLIAKPLRHTHGHHQMLKFDHCSCAWLKLRQLTGAAS